MRVDGLIVLRWWAGWETFHCYTVRAFKIKTGQQTMSDKDIHLSGQTFALPVILTGHVKKRPEKKCTFTLLRFKRTVIFFHLIFFCLLLGL